MSGPQRNARRGFALPLVMLLALVASLMVIVMLESHSVGHLATVRQVRGYQSMHQSAGLREVISRWLPTVRGRMHENLEPDGRAFRLQMPKSGTVDVYFNDGQGTILNKVDSLAGRRREILEDALEILKNPPPSILAIMPSDTTGLYRSVGPATISVATANPAVIEAVCLAVIGDPSRARQAATAVIRRAERDAAVVGAGAAGGGGGTGEHASGAEQGAIGRALSEMGLERRLVVEIEAMFVPRNTLWRVVAVGRDGAGNVIERAGGLYEGVEGRVESFNQNAGFYTWEQLPLE